MPVKHLGLSGHPGCRRRRCIRADTACVLVALAPHAPDHPFDCPLHGHLAFLTYDPLLLAGDAEAAAST